MTQPTDPNRTVDEDPSQDSAADGAGAPQPEPVIPARLELLEEIARGGMGAILRGSDADIGRDVAVKVLLEDHRGRPELAQRFLEEARIAGRLQHPGVVPVYALGRMLDGRPCFTMKLIKGRTLTALLAERKDPAADRLRFLAVFEQVCQTLAYAHARGVIHRDLKPSNVMVGAYGEVQVMDWGLAKVLPPAGVSAEAATQAVSLIQTPRDDSDTGERGDETQAGTALGTPAYMAPEQARGEIEDVGVRSDVFGLGAILCELLTGRPPFVGPSEAALKRARRADLADAMGRLDGCGADAELVALAKSCLAADPSDRPGDAGEVAAAVTAHRESVERRLRQAEVANAEARAKAVEQRKRRRLILALAASVLVTAAVVGGGWLWVAQDRTARQAEADRQAADRLTKAERTADVALVQAVQAADQARMIERAADEKGVEEPEATDVAKQALALWRQAAGSLDEAERTLTPALGARWARDRTAVRRRSVEAERGRAEKEAALLTALDEARASRVAGGGGQTEDLAAPPRRYAEALRVYGLDVSAPQAETADAIRRERPGVRLALVLALDDWASCVRCRDRVEAKQLSRIAGGADDDGWRRRYREAAGDVEALKGLAAEAPGLHLPAVSLTLLGSTLTDRGARSEAAALLRAARRQRPGDFWVYFYLTACLVDPVHPDPAGVGEAEGACWAMLALRPDSAAAWFILGLALHNKGDRDGAADCYKKSIELDPRFSPAHNNLGNVLHEQGDYDGAVACFNQAIQLDPKFALPHNNLGNVLYDQGDPKGAAACFNKAIELDPKLALPHNGLGNILHEQGDYDGAVACFNQAIQLDPKFALPHNNLALVLLHQAKFAEARAGFQRYLDLLAPNAPLRARTADQIRQCDRLLALEPKVDPVLKGEQQPADEAERVGLAEVCAYQRRYTAAVRFYRDAFADDAKLADDLPSYNRYNAACCAARAGHGDGEHARDLSDAQRCDWRKQALQWLRADLALWEKELASDKPEDRTAAVQMLQRWRVDADLSGLRDPAELAKLPAEEQEACKKFWADVQAILDKAELKK